MASRKARRWKVASPAVPRDDPELAELRPDLVVDEVLPGQAVVSSGGDLARQGDQDAGVGEHPQEPGRDGGLAGDRPGLDPALGVGGDQGRLGRLEGGQVRSRRGSSRRSSVAETRSGNASPGVEGPLGRLDGDPDQLRGVGRRPGHPVGDPAEQGPIERASRPRASGRRRGGPAAAAFRSSRLRSGAAGKTRRPRASRAIAAWSKSGSNPRSESWKPFCPRALPWQAPALQPARVRIGTTSRSNVGRSAASVAGGTPTAVIAIQAHRDRLVRSPPNHADRSRVLYSRGRENIQQA